MRLGGVRGLLPHIPAKSSNAQRTNCGLSPQFLNKAKHLAAIHKAPRETWPVLTGTS